MRASLLIRSSSIVCLLGRYPPMTQLGLPDMVHLKSLFSPSALAT